MDTLKKQYNSLHVAWRRKMETVENDQKPRLVVASQVEIQPFI